jgi:hypothetical protein
MRLPNSPVAIARPFFVTPQIATTQVKLSAEIHELASKLGLAKKQHGIISAQFNSGKINLRQVVRVVAAQCDLCDFPFIFWGLFTHTHTFLYVSGGCLATAPSCLFDYVAKLMHFIA